MRCCCVPCPIPQPDRLAAVWLHSPGIGIFRDWPSPGQYIDIQNENHSFEQMALAQSRSFTLTGREQPERIDGMRTQSSLLRMLGRQAAAGPPAAAGRGQARQAGRGDSERPPVEAAVQLGPGTSWAGASRSTGIRSPWRACCSPEFMLNAEVMPSEGPMDKVDVFLPLPLGADAVKRRGRRELQHHGAAEAAAFRCSRRRRIST